MNIVAIIELFRFRCSVGFSPWWLRSGWWIPGQWGAMEEHPVPAWPWGAGTVQQPKSGHITNPPASSSFKLKLFKIFKFFIILGIKRLFLDKTDVSSLEVLCKKWKDISVPCCALRANWAVWISHAQLCSVWEMHWLFRCGCGSLLQDLSICHPSQTLHQPPTNTADEMMKNCWSQTTSVPNPLKHRAGLPMPKHKAGEGTKDQPTASALPSHTILPLLVACRLLYDKQSLHKSTRKWYKDIKIHKLALPSVHLFLQLTTQLLFFQPQLPDTDFHYVFL